MTKDGQAAKALHPHNGLITDLEHKQLKRLEMVSIIEATTLVLLVFVAAPLKHIWGWPYGSKLLGPIHGVAFLAYVWTALQTVAGGGWHRRDVIRLFLVAFVPFGGYANLRWLCERAKSLAEGRQAR